MNGEDLIDVQEVLKYRAMQEKKLAKRMGIKSLALPYPYNTAGIEHIMMISREDYIELLKDAGVVVIPQKGTSNWLEIDLS